MTPCATSRTQACARTFSKDFPVRSSGAPLRVFHRVIMQAHALVQTQPAARAHTQTKCAPIAIAPQVSPLLCTALTLAHTSCTHMHTHSPSKTLRVLLSPRAVPPQSRRSGPPPPARRGPSTLRRNCRSHGRMRVKEWLDSCGALSTNMQRAEIDHVECRSYSDLLYNARGLKCATLAHALSLSQCLHKSSSDMSRAAAAARPSLLAISAKRNPKRPLHGALVAAVTPERPSRVHGQAEENGKPENSGKTQKSWQIEIRS